MSDTGSYQAVYDVVTSSNLQPSARMVLLAIAYDHQECPDLLPLPYELLAAYAGMNRRSVMRITKDLRQAGILSSEPGKRNVPVWTIHVNAIPKSTLSISDILKKDRAVSKVIRRLLIDRDGEHCSVPFCNTGGNIVVDHIVPRSRGGTDDLSNLHLLCSNHNSQKGVSSWDEFIQRLQQVSA